MKKLMLVEGEEATGFLSQDTDVHLGWLLPDALALDVGLGGAHKGFPREEILQGPQKMPLPELWPWLYHTGASRP